MQPSADKIMEEILRLQDIVTETRGEQISSDAVRAAVTEGIHRAVSDPDLWASAMTACQAHAQRKAGGLLMSWITGLLGKAAFFLLIGLGVYAIGGWSALAALFKGADHS